MELRDRFANLGLLLPRVALLAWVVVALVVAACGGGNGSSY